MAKQQTERRVDRHAHVHSSQNINPNINGQVPDGQKMIPELEAHLQSLVDEARQVKISFEHIQQQI